LLAEIAQPHAAIALRIGGDKARNNGVEQRVVVVQPLEADECAHESACLARLHAGREQKQQRIEVEFLSHHAVLAQILRDHRRRNAMRLIFASAAIEAGREERNLLGSVMAKPGRTLLNPCQAAPGASSQKCAWLASASVATLSHGTSCTLPQSAASGSRTTSGTNGSKNQRRAGSCSRRSNSLRTARSFLRSSMPSRM